MVHVRSEAPSAWPAPEQWHDIWPDLVDLLARETRLSARGEVIGDDADGRSQPSGLYLIGGEHGRPGAIYRLRTPDLTCGDFRLRITENRALRLLYRETEGRRGARAELGPPGPVGTITSSSSLSHLGWNLEVRAGADGLATVRVDLDWLRAEVRAGVLPGVPSGTGASSEPGEQPPLDGRDHTLWVDVRLRGRGMWRALVSGLLTVAGHWIRQGADELVAELAVDLSEHLLGRDGQAVDAAAEVRAAARRRLAATALLRDRLRRVEDAMEPRGRWRRRAAAWRREYDAHPGLEWPDEQLGAVWEEQAVSAVAHARPRQRREAIERETARLREIIEITAETEGEALQGRADGPSQALSTLAEVLAEALTDTTLDLSWLRSPLTVLSRLTGRAVDASNVTRVVSDLARN